MIIYILINLQSVVTRFCRLLKSKIPAIVRRKFADENSCYDFNLYSNVFTYLQMYHKYVFGVEEFLKLKQKKRTTLAIPLQLLQVTVEIN